MQTESNAFQVHFHSGQYTHHAVGQCYLALVGSSSSTQRGGGSCSDQQLLDFQHTGSHEGHPHCIETEGIRIS